MRKASSFHRAVGVCVLAVAGALLIPGVGMAELVAPPGTTSFTSPEQSNVTGSLARMVGGLFFCLGIFAAGVHLYRRYVAKHGVSGQRRLVIRERIAISPKASLLVVALDGKEFLVSTGTDRVTMASTQSVSAVDFSESLTEACDDRESFNA